MPTLNKPNTKTPPEQLEAEQGFIPELLAFLNGQSNRVYNSVSISKQNPPLEFWKDENRLFAGMLSAGLLSLTEAAISEQVVNVLTPAQLAVDANVNARAAAWANSHALDLAKGLNKTTKDLARQRLANWLQRETQDFDVLRKSLNEIIAPKWRADMIASTETTKAWSVARQEIANESSVIKGLQWTTANDELVCPICQPLHGQQRKKKGLYPGGLAGPPAHPRCRCGEVYTI
jgi:SPP1 gp7 family putative phage head morphogenesis protein